MHIKFYANVFRMQMWWANLFPCNEMYKTLYLSKTWYSSTSNYMVHNTWLGLHILRALFECFGTGEVVFPVDCMETAIYCSRCACTDVRNYTEHF